MKQYVISVDMDSLDGFTQRSDLCSMAFELTDFSDARILDDEVCVQERVSQYLSKGLPAGSMMMGAFHDLSVFSRDAQIRSVSVERMRQCLKIAEMLSLEMVLFHVNAPSYLVDAPDFEELLQVACQELRPLIQQFPSVKFCFENRSEADPALFLSLFKGLDDCQNIGFCLNYCRAALSPISPDRWAQILRSYLVCLRIFDSNLQERMSGQDDDLERRFERYRPFFERHFSDAQVLFGYHDLHDAYAFEEEMEEIELLEEGLVAPEELDFHERSPEDMLERIFFYMNQLVGERGFSSTILLLTDMGRTLANSERASFWYWDRKKGQYWTIVALGRDRIAIEEGTGIVGASIQNNEVLIINNPYSDGRFCSEVDLSSGFVSRSILCIPVTDSKGRVIGAFQAINKLTASGYGRFDEQDVRHLSMSAAYCGRTLEAYLLYQETLVDVLTGLKNRRGFWEYFDECVEPTLTSQPASLVMCDVDFFKQVNDVHGHAAGDAVLKLVSGILQDAVGEQGAVARWGGEEFILILRKTTLEQAREFAERLRIQIENSSCPWENGGLRITMSFGVAEVHAEQPVEKDIEEADRKLYVAKKNGRNQVVC